MSDTSHTPRGRGANATILLLGGTSETAPIAQRLADAGHSVLVSTATDEPLHIGTRPRLRRRCGRLDESSMADLARREAIAAIVDATHPYAAIVRATAERVSAQLGIPYLTFLRPGLALEDQNVLFAADHDEAARLAFSFARPVLLTTGSNNLAPYVHQSTRTGLPLIARVLPRDDSRQACLSTGLSESHIIALKGPFSVDENRAHLRQFHIGVLVTKDSGDAGGVPEKLRAAELERCRVVVVRRPAMDAHQAFDNIEALLARIDQLL